jgi:hypothetical protein
MRSRASSYLLVTCLLCCGHVTFEKPTPAETTALVVDTTGLVVDVVQALTAKDAPEVQKVTVGVALGDGGWMPLELAAPHPLSVPAMLALDAGSPPQ